MVEAAKKDGTINNLNPIVIDTKDIVSPLANSIDVFYARSSLHLSDVNLYALFNKIIPALKPSGIIFIEGKPITDLKMSRSRLIDTNLYEDTDGHIRRSWDPAFIVKICGEFNLSLFKIDERTEYWEGNETKFINFLAKKII